MKYRFIAFKAILSVFIVLAMLSIEPIPTNAGFVSGDEPIGGFSYLMDCAYKNEIPTGLYADWYYRAYHRFHYEIPLDETSRAILERIVEAEATGGNVKQKMNVASCILARVQSKSWPDTVEGVVFDNDGVTWQFSPISDGRYYTVSITDSTREAVESVSKSGLTHQCMWFCSDGSYNKTNEKGEYVSYHRLHHTYAFFDGEHHYFYD